MAGAVATYVLLEMFIGSRERREAKKADLIAQLGSSVHDVAIEAAEELARHGWLYDGSLRRAYLVTANLEGAHLFGANLTEASLCGATLDGATLVGANLRKANLLMASLKGAHMSEADLREAIMSDAWLYDASLRKADLREASLDGTKFDERTILPDGENWTPDTNLARFTDPSHPDFWRPDAEQ